MRLYSLTPLKNAILENPRYPICRINGKSFYDEQVMSMPTLMANTTEQTDSVAQSEHNGHYFFFLFNLDNYYHFLYDTLPYLVHYFELLKTVPSCKILLSENHNLLPFQREMLTRLGLESQIVYASNLGCYEYLYVPSSLTHGKSEDGQSCSNEIYSPSAMTVWNKLCKDIPINPSLPKKIYISRRTWIHNDLTNIGTNYTTRRRCMNEEDVVRTVEAHGYTELFCEKMTTDEKIALFQSATHVIGFIGGGMANLLFSNPATRVGCIETPDFLRINERFKFSMAHTDITYLPITKHSSYEGLYSLYTRVKIQNGRIGEITEWNAEKGYRVNVSNNDVAGFALNGVFEDAWFQPSELEPLDKGLNSPFICDIDGLNQYLCSI